MLRLNSLSGTTFLFALALFFSPLALAADETGGLEGGAAASVPVQRQIPVIDQTAEVPGVDDIVDHCNRLPEIDQPAKGCDCLYEAYQGVLEAQNSGNDAVYQDWKRSLANAEKRILANNEPSVLMETQNFCAVYYGNPDDVDIVTNPGTRDKAVMTPKFENKEDQTAFTNAKLELYRATGGASDLYCRAYFEVRAYERIAKRHPLTGASPSQAYAKLSRSHYCYVRFR